MSRSRTLGMAALAAVAVLWASARWTLLAQDGAARRAPRDQPRQAEPRRDAAGSLRDALSRPIDLPFARETSLKDVAAYLRRALNAQVVLDLAALKRLGITADATVQIELEKVHPKVGLKLLLDQVGLTCRVEEGDNLLILTDDEGAEDAQERTFRELKAIHRELHDLKDAVEEVYQAVAPEDEVGPAMRKPTIIEEVPGDEPAPAAEEKAPPRVRPGT